MLGSDGNIIAAGDVEGIMVLTDGEGSAVVVTDNGSAVAILPEGTVILEDGEGNIVMTDDKGNTIMIRKTQPKNQRATLLSPTGTGTPPYWMPKEAYLAWPLTGEQLPS